eukprot:1862-Heterococcus_DN1.PRE.1
MDSRLPDFKPWRAFAILTSHGSTHTSCSMAAATRAASAAYSRHVLVPRTAVAAVSEGSDSSDNDDDDKKPLQLMWPAIMYNSLEEWARENQLCAKLIKVEPAHSSNTKLVRFLHEEVPVWVDPEDTLPFQENYETYKKQGITETLQRKMMKTAMKYMHKLIDVESSAAKVPASSSAGATAAAGG